MKEYIHDLEKKCEFQQNTINDLVKELDTLNKKGEDLHNERCAFVEKAKALEEQRNKLLEEIAGYGDTIKKQRCELQAKENNIIMLGESLAKVEREADKAEIYKEMYMTLLDKLISVRGEA